MGRRSRKRAASPREEPPRPAPEPVAAPPRPPAGPRRRRARLDEAPPAPWHPFPLVELAIFAGLVLLLVGFFLRDEAGSVLVIGGLILVFVASLELAVREHFSGYRSHSSLLALAAAFAIGVPLWLTGLFGRAVVVAVGAGLGVAAFLALRNAFAKRAGGLSWRS
jgi:hypothetical protein